MMKLQKLLHKVKKEKTSMKRDFEHKIQLGLRDQAKIVKEKDTKFMQLSNERNEVQENLKTLNQNYNEAIKEN